MDREKIISELEVIKYFFRQCRENFSLGSDVENSLFDLQEAASGAVALLKEQEAIEPDVDSEGTCTCGNCGENVGWYPAGSKEPVRLCKYCPECGKAVKWNDR